MVGAPAWIPPDQCSAAWRGSVWGSAEVQEAQVALIEPSGRLLVLVSLVFLSVKLHRFSMRFWSGPFAAVIMVNEAGSGTVGSVEWNRDLLEDEIRISIKLQWLWTPENAGSQESGTFTFIWKQKLGTLVLVLMDIPLHSENACCHIPQLDKKAFSNQTSYSRDLAAFSLL